MVHFSSSGKERVNRMITKREILGGMIAGGVVGVAPALADDCLVPHEGKFVSECALGDIVLVTDRGFYPVGWSLAGPPLDYPVDRTIDKLVDLELEGAGIRHIELSKDAYRFLRKADLIDRVRNHDGSIVMSTFLGYRIQVPDSAIR